MGIDFVPVYGEVELGSALETAEKVIAKVKSNKFDKKDLIALADALKAVEQAIDDYEE